MAETIKLPWLNREVEYEVTREDRVVEMLLDESGKAYTRVRTEPHADGRWVVLDRESGHRQGIMSVSAIRSRAQSMAILLGLRYVEDLRWPCVALSKLSCRCPLHSGATGVRQGYLP